MSLSHYNAKTIVCKVALIVLGVAACYGGLWLFCTVTSAVLNWAGVA